MERKVEGSLFEEKREESKEVSCFLAHLPQSKTHFLFFIFTHLDKFHFNLSTHHFFFLFEFICHACSRHMKVI